MDAIFAMDQYYSSSSSTSTVDDNDSKFELESYDAVMTSPEVDVCSTKTASPDPKSSPSERASSDRSASPRDAQSWNSSNRRRKRAEEIHRPYVCGWDGCNKAYGRLNHLNTHIAIHRHGQRKTGMDFPQASRKKGSRTPVSDIPFEQPALSSSGSSSRSSISDTSPMGTSCSDEPFNFSTPLEWSTPFFQGCEPAETPLMMNNYTYLGTQKMRHEHGRNQALTRVKTLEQERNSLSEELSRLEQQLVSERHTFTCEQQNLERTIEELGQWRYTQGDEAMWFQ